MELLSLKNESRRGCGPRRKERGFILILFAASAFVLVAFVGMAIDVGFIYHQKRKMQLAADAGAIAAAQEIRQGRTDSYASAGRNDVSLNGFTDGQSGSTVTVVSPPTSGSYANNAQYVQVSVSQPQPTFFMQMFRVFNVPMAARASAWTGGMGGNGCIILLHPTFEGAYYTDGSATVNTDCGMWVNSNSSKAIDNQGRTTMGAAIHVVGQVNNSGTISPTPLTNAASTTDPLSTLPFPSTSGMTTQTIANPLNGSVTLNPGIYNGGIKLASGANVTLNPGNYYLNNGGLFLTGATIRGTAVTLFFTGTQSTTPILLDTVSTANLTAPASGTYQGILFFVNRNTAYKGLPWCMDIQSNGTNVLEGALYFPTCSVLWQSQSAAYLGANTVIVAQYLRVDGSGTKLNIHSNFNGYATGGQMQANVKLSE
jgi:hypothetical protein